ncbi:endonuclease [Micromonospora sp. BQ11]|uniref:endonuclease n=1 Tax=Micromonospora sp. BQ11 TaxID=3452212 RepID=UPI003F8A9323
MGRAVGIGADLPDAFEQRRDQRIHEAWQGNRNPFVDHPEGTARSRAGLPGAAFRRTHGREGAA